MKTLANQFKNSLRQVKYRLTGELRSRRAVITQPTGTLQSHKAEATFLMVVGPQFNQNIPNAMMTCRMGYCKAFELLGIPYRIVDINDLEATLDDVSNPFCMTVGYEFASSAMTRALVRKLANVPHAVWVNPWFTDSKRFYAQHGLDGSIWHWPASQRRKIIDSNPAFVFSATTDRGLGFFNLWENHGLKASSLPLACDTTLYHAHVPHEPQFDHADMAFVGGYWASKARQIDPYLRPFEDQLCIYGYNNWPYRGYRGQISREAEPSLYRQTRVCPTVNEPSVAILHGQINERVFKILGCGGCTVVDAVPAYRDLFTEDELPIPADVEAFIEQVRYLMNDESARLELSQRGHQAVMQRHTYIHRAKTMLEYMGLHSLLENTNLSMNPDCAGSAQWRHCA